MNFETKQAEIAIIAELDRQTEDDAVDKTIAGERLQFIFTCCHPALAADAQVAHALQTIAGLTTREIARSFVVPETKMAQRLVRAKRKMKAAAIPFRVPPPERWTDRFNAILSVL